MTPEEARGFVRAQTRLCAPSLLPELPIHLCDAVTPLWEASEAVLQRTGVAPPYWAFAWPGGQALARLVLDEPGLVAGRTVLDFAAGSGVAAIAAARAGAARVEASEIDRMAIEAIRLNAEANGVVVETLASDVTTLDPGSWDVILAGDVCYEATMTRVVWPWLQRAAASGVTVLLADPGRAYLPNAGLERVGAFTVPTTLDLEDRTERVTTLWRVRPG